LNSFGFLILLHELIADQAKGRQALPAGLHHAGATHAMALAVRTYRSTFPAGNAERQLFEPPSKVGYIFIK